MCLSNVLEASTKMCQCSIPIWDTYTSAEIQNGVIVYRCFNCSAIIPLEHYYCEPSHTQYTGTTLDSFKALHIKSRKLYKCGKCQKLILHKRFIPTFLNTFRVFILFMVAFGVYEMYTHLF